MICMYLGARWTRILKIPKSCIFWWISLLLLLLLGYVMHDYWGPILEIEKIEKMTNPQSNWLGASQIALIFTILQVFLTCTYTSCGLFLSPLYFCRGSEDEKRPLVGLFESSAEAYVHERGTNSLAVSQRVSAVLFFSFTNEPRAASALLRL